jgi:hypothetical protein
VSLLSIHCQLSTSYNGQRNHRYCGGDRGPDQPCYCQCHFPESGRTWECHHAPRLGGRPILLPTPMQIRSWANRARFSLVHPGRLR